VITSGTSPYLLSQQSKNQTPISTLKMLHFVEKAAIGLLLCHFCFQPFPTIDALATPGPNGASSAKHTHDAFETFVAMRTGIDTTTNTDSAEPKPMKPAFWIGIGQLLSAPSGKPLATIEGFDVSSAVRINKDTVRQFSRKIFWYRDIHTNEIITEFEGKPVRPIKYDWQVFDYKRGVANPMHPSQSEEAHAPIHPSIVSSMGSTSGSVPCMPITPKYAGSHILTYQFPLFIDIQTEKIKYRAWEIYDYTVPLGDSHDGNLPPSICWTRQGDAAPFCVNGEGVMHITGHRVKTFEDLPLSMRELIEGSDEYSLFKNPPRDMEEVSKLQAEFQEKIKLMRTR
jgi:hypothetical protein